MNQATVRVLEENIATSCENLYYLMQDYLANASPHGNRYYLLMLALEEMVGNEDSNLTYSQLFAEDYTDKDLDMVNKDAVLHNRKAIENYKKFNSDRGWS
jgi:hypothetical protein